MARDITTGLRDASLASAVIPATFIQIDTPSAGSTYLWLNGLGTLSWNGHDWIGSGRTLSISPVNEVTGAQASGVVFTLSGLSADNLTLVLDNIGRYQPAKIWVGALTEAMAVISTPYLMFSGRIDTAEVSADGTTATIAGTFESRLLTLMKPRERRYTDRDQRIERSYDGGFKFVEQLADSPVQWNGIPVAAPAAAAASAITSTAAQVARNFNLFR